MQTHQNVRLKDTSFNGQELTQPKQLFYAQGQWFIKAHAIELRKHYPAIDDTIFLDRELPYYSKLPSSSPKLVYLPISAGTAKILQDPQGYASMPVLQSEIEKAASNKSSFAREHLNAAQSFPIRATFEAHSGEFIITDGIPIQEPSQARRILAGLDMVFVDAPGTFLYNVAIPFMAPFYFFKYMRIDQQQDPFN